MSIRDDLHTKRARELRDMARDYGISGRGDMTRAELIEALYIPMLEERVERLEGIVLELGGRIGAQEHKVNPFTLIGGK